MTDFYLWLAISALLIFLVAMGIWAYRVYFIRPVSPPEEIIPEVPPLPPKVADKKRRARVARMSSTSSSRRR